MTNMKKNFTQVAPDNPIRYIEYIAHQASDSWLSDEFMAMVETNCRKLSWYLECNQIQAVLFSVLCNINFSHRAVGIDRLATWLGCTPITVAMYVNELEDLRERRILRKETGENQNDFNGDNSIASIYYSVNPEVFEALRKGEKFKKQEIFIRDNYELIKAVAGWIQQRAEGQIEFKEMEREIMHILSEYSKMEFLREMNRTALSDKERILFLNLCDEYYNGCTTSNLPSMVKLVTSDKREQMSIRHQIAGGYSGLNHSDLVECGEAGFRNDLEISLTDKAIGMIVKDDPKIVLDKKEIKMPDVMLSGSIPEKALYFTPEVQERYSEISELLMPANYDKLVRRLRKNGMKTGFAMLFEGPPGTGKTESVYQLARMSGRNIFQVAISDLKSKWYGDSEKLIKNLFDRYRRLTEKSEIIPLCLFNEADGVFSSRKMNGSSAVDQTENAMQNIILQELEDVNGILIATTNLVENLDQAFDRRFMFKIHFGKPTPEARFRIWQEKIPFLTGTAVMELAEKHELSGGQIDNIARKCTMHRVLKNKLPVRMLFESWCIEESGNIATNRIGYRY
jgi:hypothetical protein